MDSRTVWVEQQHVGNSTIKLCFPRENLPLGPGEYTPKYPAKELNVSTPYIGRRDIFQEYQPNNSAWSSKFSELTTH